jgi:hypothetical protein
MGRDNEYQGAMIAVLELVWGAGFMAPGGKGNVDRMVEDWRAMMVVCGKGEMRQGYSRGRRPPPGE